MVYPITASYPASHLFPRMARTPSRVASRPYPHLSPTEQNGGLTPLWNVFSQGRSQKVEFKKEEDGYVEFFGHL